MSQHRSPAYCPGDPDRIHRWGSCSAPTCSACGRTRYQIAKEVHRLRRKFARVGIWGPTWERT